MEKAKRTFKLATKGAKVNEIEMGFRERFLATVSNPNIAYILMMIGLVGLYFELSNPGAIFPGIIGGICLILAFFAFRTLPVNYAGVLLILLGRLSLHCRNQNCQLRAPHRRGSRISRPGVHHAL